MRILYFQSQTDGGPPQGAAFCRSLIKMYVVEDVLLAEAVIPLAAGAVPELQVRPLRVGPSADGALVAVAPLLLPLSLLPGGGLELDGLVGGLVFRPAPPPGDLVGDVGPEEDDEVENGDDGQQGTQEVPAQQAQQNLEG